MKVTKLIIASFFIICSTVIQAQLDFKFALEINVDYGISGDFSDAKRYKTRTANQSIDVDQKSTKRTRNYMFSIAHFLNVKNGLKFSFGYSKFAFNVVGRNDVTSELLNTSYNITYLELGTSYIRRIPFSNDATLLIEPGIRFHASGDIFSTVIRMGRKDAFAISFYSGIEVPMTNNHFYTNLGIQLKLPLGRYTREFLDVPALYPYFIGLKVGLNFQFFPY